MYEFTTLCRQINDAGTTHVTCVQVEDNDATLAAVRGRQVCAQEWDMPQTEIKVIAVALGNVEFPLFDDEGIELPAPRELSIKVEIDAFPRCDFRGSKVFDIENDELECPELLESSLDELEQLLEDAEVGDDPGGRMIEQIEEAVRHMVQGWDRGLEPKLKNLVLAAGYPELDKDGDPVESMGRLVIEETFDINVWIKPILTEVADEEEE